MDHPKKHGKGKQVQRNNSPTQSQDNVDEIASNGDASSSVSSGRLAIDTSGESENNGSSKVSSTSKKKSEQEDSDDSKDSNKNISSSSDTQEASTSKTSPRYKEKNDSPKNTSRSSAMQGDSTSKSTPRSEMQETKNLGRQPPKVTRTPKINYLEAISSQDRHEFLDKKKLYECSLCGILFQDNDIQQYHIQLHGGVDFVTCFCGDVFYKAHQFNLHLYESCCASTYDISPIKKTVRSSDPDGAGEQGFSKIDPKPTKQSRRQEDSDDSKDSNKNTSSSSDTQEAPTSKASPRSELPSRSSDPEHQGGNGVMEVMQHGYSERGLIYPQAHKRKYEDSDNGDSRSDSKTPRLEKSSPTSENGAHDVTTQPDGDRPQLQLYSMKSPSLSSQAASSETEEFEEVPQAGDGAPLRELLHCCGCQVLSDDTNDLSPHRLAVWKDYKFVYMCSYCRILYRCYIIYTYHMHAHTPGDPFRCTCGVKCEGDDDTCVEFVFNKHYYDCNHSYYIYLPNYYLAN